jgi:hypothetical protein
MFLNFVVLCVGLFVLIRHEALARQQLHFRKHVLKHHGADELGAIRGSKVVYVIVGTGAVLWAAAAMLGVPARE